VKTDILIVGGGLSGLHLADKLQQAELDYRLIEARNRLGGRVLSLPSGADNGNTDRYDLGPAWYWPGQPLLQRLVDELGLSVFPQHSDGNLVYQHRDGTVQRDLQFSTMAGSLRLSGGVHRLIEALSQRIPADRIVGNSKAIKHSLCRIGIRTTLQKNNAESEIESSVTALAVPPRLAAHSMVFEPTLGSEALDAMRSIPTWMAAHAKVIALYDKPFWREAGLSGDGISQRGPLTEIHDATPSTGATGALFGFVGVTASVRRSDQREIARLAVEQLVAMFGPRAAQPFDVLVQDWAREEFTATADDEAETLQQHPAYGTPPVLANLWDGKLLLASTEMAPTFGGYLEGALQAAEHAAARIVRAVRT